MSVSASSHPIEIEIDYPAKLGRISTFFRGILWIPHYIALIFLFIGLFFSTILAWFAVLFTGRYPEGLWNYGLGVHRWQLRVGSYVLLQTDRYPPFSLEYDADYPVRLLVEHPDRIHRWRCIPYVLQITAIPAFIVTAVLGLLAYIGVIIAWFAILITGRYPRGIFNLTTSALKWSVRTQMYVWLMTEAYPSGA
jgi:hypothetical protein